MKINTILLLIGKIKGQGDQKMVTRGQKIFNMTSRSPALKTEKSDSKSSVAGESEPLVNFGNISAAAEGAPSPKPGPRSRGRSRLQANSRMKQYFTRMNNKNSKTLWDKRDSSPLDDMGLDQGS